MSDEELLKALKSISVETGSLVCLGCGHEHNCGIHGCAILREGVERFAKALQDGRGATWPKELWAVKPAPASNDWNDRPKYHIVHYIVHAYEPETGRYYVNTDGWPGKKHRHWINGNGLYESRAEAEKALRGAE